MHRQSRRIRRGQGNQTDMLRRSGHNKNKPFDSPLHVCTHESARLCLTDQKSRIWASPGLDSHSPHPCCSILCCNVRPSISPSSVSIQLNMYLPEGPHVTHSQSPRANMQPSTMRRREEKMWIAKSRKLGGISCSTHRDHQHFLAH